MDGIETIRKRFAIIGIEPYQSTRLTKNLLVLLMYAINLTMNGTFLIYGADNFQEYVNSAFTCSTLIVGTTAFAIIIWKMKKIMKFLKHLDKTIKKRKY